MEPKRLHPGPVLENGATLEGGAVFSFSTPLDHSRGGGISLYEPAYNTKLLELQSVLSDYPSGSGL